MKKFLLFIIFLFVGVLQAQPWTEDFESQHGTSYITGTITINGRVWTVKDAGNFAYANTNMGSYAFTINDDKPGAYITTPALNTCGTVSFKYAYKNGNSTNVFVLQKSTDGTTFEDLETHTLGASSNLSYVNYSFSVNDNSSSVYIRILSDDQNAHLFIDDFSVTAYSGGGAVENPSGFSASAGGADNIDLEWTNNQAGDSVMIAYHTTLDFGTPSNGTLYSVGSTISDSGTVIFVGKAASYNHSGLNSNTLYYYKAWSIHNKNYSSGVTTNARTTKEEPTNHVSGFTATATSSSKIDLRWTENDGTVVPDGYLIKVTAGEDSISTPTDGTDNDDDTDLSNGSGEVKVSHGTTSYSWTGLSANTTYYFKIYPYTNSGSHIDYKTDGTVPQANATTNEAPRGATDLIISEYVEGSGNNKYIEIYNGTGADVDLSDYEIRLYSNGASTPSNTETLSGTLASGETLVLANSSATIYTGTVINSSVCNFNGDDAIAIYNTSTNKYVDIFGVIGDDPGSAWTSGSYSTVDKTLRRKSNVAVGVRKNPSGTGSGAFTTLDTEWDLYDQDDVDDLGSHTFSPVPAGSSTHNVATGNNSYTFANTSVRINFKNVTTSSDVTVKKYNNPPANVSGISESNISEYRWVIDGGTINFGSDTEIRFKASELEGISDPSTATIVLYKRSQEGSGSFTSLGTMNYDSDNDELWVTTSGFSEYVMASNDANLPVELTSFSATVSDNAVKLTWTTATEVNNYGFEIERTSEKNTWETLGFVEGAGNSNSPKEYSFIDNSVSNGKYTYRLKQIDLDGSYKYSKEVEVTVGAPTKFELAQNYPNPFNPTTTINYAIPKVGESGVAVQLKVYDALGREVATLVNTKQTAGEYNVKFDASKLTSGIYFYTLRAGNFVQTRKMILMK